MSLLQTSHQAPSGAQRTARRASAAAMEDPALLRRSWRSYRRRLRAWLVVQDAVLAMVPAVIIALTVAGTPSDAQWVLGTNALLVVMTWTCGTMSEDVLGEATTGWRRTLSALPVTVMGALLVAQVLGTLVPWYATLVAAPLGALAIIVGRIAEQSFLRNARMDGHGLRRALVVVGDGGEEMIHQMRLHPGDGYLIVGAVCGSTRPAADVALPRILGKPGQLHDLVIGHDIDVVLAVGAVHPADQTAALRGVEGTDARFIVMPGLSHVAPERVHALPSAAAWTGAVEVTPRKALGAGKRVVDLVVGGILTLIALLIIVPAAIAVKMTDGGPAFYTQKRIGKDGIPFTMFKLRSMYVDADARRAAVLAEMQDKGEGNEVLFKSADDPRITPVGRFIRRFSIDELPQIFNVMLGDMSLIGPRPALAEEVAKYDAEARRRLLVRPGMTGLWQVSGRSDLSWERTVELDGHYVDNASPALDLHIASATAKAVLGGKGAY